MPNLASHWKVSEDKLTFTFRIDPDARFADGSRVTAQDVVATFKLIMDESINSPSMQQTYRRYNEPVALSPYLVEVSCTEQNWRNFLILRSKPPHPERLTRSAHSRVRNS